MKPALKRAAVDVAGVIAFGAALGVLGMALRDETWWLVALMVALLLAGMRAWSRVCRVFPRD